RTWKLLERIQPALFAQLVVVPLFRDHRILSQGAGHGFNVLKAVPPPALDVAQGAAAARDRRGRSRLVRDRAGRNGRPRREDAARARPLRPAGRPRRADAARAVGSELALALDSAPGDRLNREAQMTIDLR